MQAHLPYTPLQKSGRTSSSSAAGASSRALKIWRNTLTMVALLVLTYWLALYWLLPSVGTASAGFRAPVVCLLFWLACSFGDRAARYRRR